MVQDPFEKAAFDAIIERYTKPIFNVAFGILNNYEDAMDITQNTFMRAYENRSRFDPRYKIFSWLYKIAIHESLNYLNKRKRETVIQERMSDTSPNPHAKAVERETNEQLYSAIRELKFDYRIILILRHFHDLSYGEIGEIVGIPVRTVKSRLFTARHLLKEALMAKGFGS